MCGDCAGIAVAMIMMFAVNLLNSVINKQSVTFVMDLFHIFEFYTLCEYMQVYIVHNDIIVQYCNVIESHACTLAADFDLIFLFKLNTFCRNERA